jgi:Tfp pilus assembly protein PilF
MRKAFVIVLIVAVLCISFSAADKKKAKSLFDSAYEHLQKEQYVESMTEYKEALLNDPDNTDISGEYMICLRKAGYLQRAAREGWVALEKKPKDWKLWNNLGNTFLQAYAWDSAMQCYKMVEKYNKNKVWVSKNFINLGHEQYNSGEYDKAIETYNYALEVNKADGLATIGLGAAICAKGDKDTGKKLITIGILACSMLSANQHPKEDLGSFKGVLDFDDCIMPWSPWTSRQTMPVPLLSAPEKGKASELQIQDTVVRRYLMPDLSYLAISTPEEWYEILKPVKAPNSNFTICFKSSADNSFEVLLSALITAVSIEKLQDTAKVAANSQLAGALEKEVNLIDISNAGTKGYAFLLTDKSLTSKLPSSGEYKYAMTGILNTGNHTVLVTLLSNTNDKAFIDRILQMMKSTNSQ